VILDGDGKVGSAKVYKTALEMKQAKQIENLKAENQTLEKRIAFLTEQNKVMRECVEFYAEASQYRKNDPYGILWKDRGKQAVQCLKELEE
jgi:ASC-1-like (ASCH) protein